MMDPATVQLPNVEYLLFSTCYHLTFYLNPKNLVQNI